MSIRLKICGVTDPKNLEEIIDYCDYVGVIVDKNIKSPRRVDESTAKKLLEICIRNRKQAIALAVSRDGIDLAHSLGFDIVQIHRTDISLVEYAVSKGLSVVPVYVSPSRDVDEKRLSEFLRSVHSLRGHVEFVLLDGDKSLPSLDSGLKLSIESYSVFVRMCREHGFRAGVAGGITPLNVELLLGLRPDVVDVSSGVEVRPGVKDVEKVRALRMRLQIAR